MTIDMVVLQKRFDEIKAEAEIDLLINIPHLFCEAKNHVYRIEDPIKHAAYCCLYSRIAQNCKYNCEGNICGYDVETK